MNPRPSRALREAWLTETQAIAIYRAEIALLQRTAWSRRRRASLELCRAILEEELEHQGWVERLEAFSQPPLAPAHRFAGSVLGIALGLLPSRLSWKLHELAELQAEAAYLQAARISEDADIEETLRKAAAQEREHSVRFKALRKETPDG